jgi:exosortase/archaeosortase family protein
MKQLYNLLIRYLILIIVALPNLWIFYSIFTPLTIYPSYFILSLFMEATLLDNILILEGLTINIVEACIAGAAYYLLLILNLTTPMSIKKRILSILTSFALFLAINIIRISVSSVLALRHPSIFGITHMFVWYFLSGVIVFLVWIFTIKIFKIRDIPVYTDIIYLKSLRKSKQTQKIKNPKTGD